MEDEQLNRQQRRQRQRRSKKFDKKGTFTKQEVDQMNKQAYILGQRFALEGARVALGLGEKRIDRIRQEIHKLEAAKFGGVERTD